MDVHYDPAATVELNALPVNERIAIVHAVEKLVVFGTRLPFPHSSKVQGAEDLWELRPRAGRSRWRAFYRRVGTSLVIGAIGPEAKTDPPGFRRAIAAAEERLAAHGDI